MAIKLDEIKLEKVGSEVLGSLLAPGSSPAVTIYAPMHADAAPRHISENQLRLKNLVAQAAEQLPAHGPGHELAKNLLKLADEVHNDLGFWEKQTPGLLICARPQGGIRLLQLPIDTEEYVAVDDNFHLAPVIGLVHDSRDFYVLALAQRYPQLYKGTLYGLAPADVKLPDDARTALGIDELNQRTEHQGTSVRPGNRPHFGWFSGHGGARNAEAEERLKFFRLIDHIINSSTEQTWPLILAGTDEEVAMYRHISRYPNLLAPSISGNHANNPRRLSEPARSLIWQAVVAREHQEAIEDYRNSLGANPARATDDMRSITDAAANGRVDKLLTSLLKRTADTVRDQAEELPRLTFPPLTAKNLNQVAAAVWQSRGQVYNLLPEEMPAGAIVAARLRY